MKHKLRWSIPNDTVRVTDRFLLYSDGQNSNSTLLSGVVQFNIFSLIK